MESKLLACIIVACLLILVIGCTKGKNPKNTRKQDLKGPAAKNYKPWRHKDSTSTIPPIDRVTGPVAKNKKPKKPQQDSVPPIQRVLGPEAKNKKP